MAATSISCCGAAICPMRGRAYFLELMDEQLLITGHTPCANGFFSPNEVQLILDCMGSPADIASSPQTGLSPRRIARMRRPHLTRSGGTP